MKINTTLINKAYGNQINGQDTKKGKSLGIKQDVTTKNTDTLVVSQEAMNAKTVSKATKAIVEELNEDYGNQHIALLKEAIQNGTYKIDSEKIAQAMVNHVRVLGGKDE